MNDNTRIDDLEIRLMHQEAALEQVTATLLEQEHLIAEQARAIAELKQQLRALTPSPVADQSEETPPPHY